MQHLKRLTLHCPLLYSTPAFHLQPSRNSDPSIKTTCGCHKSSFFACESDHLMLHRLQQGRSGPGSIPLFIVLRKSVRIFIMIIKLTWYVDTFLIKVNWKLNLDKIPRPSRQLHQQLWRRSTRWCLCSNITKCLKIFSTSTTCECERNVSASRRLKTYLRSTMSQTRVTGLPLMHAHYDMDIDFDETIRSFAKLHPRRMELALHCLNESKSQERAL